MSIDSNYYPIIGFFTNNTNDIRPLEFYSSYNKNFDSLYNKNNEKKYIKYEYFELFIDGFFFLEKMREIVEKKDLMGNNNSGNYLLNKWLYDFIIIPEKKKYSIFIHDDFVSEPYDKFHKIIKKNIDKNPDGTEIDLDSIDGIFKLNILQIIENIINELENVFLSKFDGYIDKNNSSFIDFDKKSGIKEFILKMNRSIRLDNNLIKRIDRKNNKIVSEVHEKLNYKYKIFSYEKKIDYHNTNANLDLDLESSSKTHNCFRTYLNIDYNECNKIIDNVIKEDGYSTKSREFFRKDKNFRIFSAGHQYDIGVDFNIIKIKELLNKLQFRIKIRYISSFDKSILNYKKFEIKYYENFDTWKKHQTVDLVLNSSVYLKDYLNTCIDFINKKIVYLNKDFSKNNLDPNKCELKNSVDAYDKVKYRNASDIVPEMDRLRNAVEMTNFRKSKICIGNPNDVQESINKLLDDEGRKELKLYSTSQFREFANSIYNKNLDIKTNTKELKELYTKILELFEDKDVNKEKFLNYLSKHKKLMNSYKNEFEDIINYNYLNKIGIISSYFKKPNLNNLQTMVNILNYSYSFDNKLIKLY